MLFKESNLEDAVSKGSVSYDAEQRDWISLKDDRITKKQIYVQTGGG